MDRHQGSAQHTSRIRPSPHRRRWSSWASLAVRQAKAAQRGGDETLAASYLAIARACADAAINVARAERRT